MEDPFNHLNRGLGKSPSYMNEAFCRPIILIYQTELLIFYNLCTFNCCVVMSPCGYKISFIFCGWIFMQLS